MLNKITTCVEADYDAMSRKAADLFAKALRKKPGGVYGFATGGTPVGMYEHLARMRKETGLSLTRMTAFNLDEYHPISQGDPQSYFTFMRNNLFDPIGLNASQTHIPNGSTDDPAAECVAYDQKIEDAGGIDVQILGIGANGHIGFNEPAEFFSAGTSYVPLTEVTVQSNARFFDGPETVPRHAITMGIRSIMMCRRIILLASGEGKAAILRDALYGPITPLVPASVLQLHRDVTVVADKAAAAFL
jgi:glucosamine-6-phosphate deaminase